MVPLFVLLGLALSAFVLSSCLRRTSKLQALPLPPGPKTSWLGRVKLPQTFPWLTYAQWKDVYGDLIYIYVFGNPILVLNSAEAVTDLLDKRSGNYSSRPVRTMVVELMGWDWLFSAMPYGLWWRRHRTLFHKYFHLNAFMSHQPCQLKETHTLLRNLLRDPKDFNHHVRRTAAAIVLNIAYGHQVAEEGDDYVTIADKALIGLSQAGIFGTYLVDYIPSLKFIPSWIPGTATHKALKWRVFTREMVNRPFQMVKRAMSKGTADSCIVVQELSELSDKNDPEKEKLIQNVAAIVYAAGADTTVSAILSFILAMVLHPEIQKRAQDELDRVLGDRLPSFNDKDQLPFMSCIVWECLRWRPVTNLGLPHYVTEDDEYKGHFIPKGTTVLPNTWAILHDATAYPDPLAFKPQRFEDPEALRRNNPLPHAAFGFGRRMCPGRWLAWDSIWIAVASVLKVYNISPIAPDLLPKVAYTSGTLSRPEPFECRITPRSDSASAMIRDTGPN